MTTIYKFKSVYTKLGIGTNPSVAPVITVVDSSNNILVNAQATTNISNIPGLYVYSYSGSDGLDLVGFFSTSDTTVDVQNLYSYTSDKITTNLNATISSIPSASANSTAVWSEPTRTLTSFGTLVADVWTNSTRTLSSYGTLVADIWSYVTRTLTSSGGATAADIWSYTTRTLTDYLINGVTLPSSTTNLTMYNYSTIAALIDSVVDESEIWFTVKKHKHDLDTESIIQISKTGGLLYLNGMIPTNPLLGLTSADGEIEVVNGQLSVLLSADAAIYLSAASQLFGEVKVKSATDVVTVISQFTVIVKDTYTKTI